MMHDNAPMFEPTYQGYTPYMFGLTYQGHIPYMFEPTYQGYTPPYMFGPTYQGHTPYMFEPTYQGYTPYMFEPTYQGYTPNIPIGNFNTQIFNQDNGVQNQLVNFSQHCIALEYNSILEPNSLIETLNKIKKDSIYEYSNNDFDIFFTPNGLYFHNKMNNLLYAKEVINSLLPNHFSKCQEFFSGKILFFPQIFIVENSFIEDSEVIIYSLFLAKIFIFLNLKKDMFIRLNTGELLLIKTENILKRIKETSYTLFFDSPLYNPLVQDLNRALYNSNYLFLDSKTQDFIRKENLPCLKELEKKLEEIKSYVG